MDGIEVDTSKTYKFSNRFSGPDFVLAVTTNGSAMSLSMIKAGKASSSGQWFLTRVNGNQPAAFYRMHAASLGVGQSMDVVNDGGAVTSSQLQMSASSEASGQAWRFDMWSDDDSDGYRLSNKFTGPDIHLDVVADSLNAQLFGGDFAGQHWTMATAGGSPPQDDSSNPMLLSTGGIVGLSIVAALGLGLLACGALYWLVWGPRKKAGGGKKNRGGGAAELGGEDDDTIALRKGSVHSFHSQRSAERVFPDLHPLQTAALPQPSQPSQPSYPPGPQPSSERADTVSPATYRQGSMDITRSNTGVSERTLVTISEPLPPAVAYEVAELPDQRY